MRFVPKSQDGAMGEIECQIEGAWKECILYEVPIMSISAYRLSQRRIRLADIFSERGVLQVR